uniref:RHS protein n=1 Tax=Rheinheimera sp. BAL341 TaxID=1708203 RepID=A0A486XSH0_9GAMM
MTSGDIVRDTFGGIAHAAIGYGAGKLIQKSGDRPSWNFSNVATDSFGYVLGDPINFIDSNGLAGMDWLWGAIYNATGGATVPQGVVDAAAGFGDALSFGLTDKIRDWNGTNGAVDKCSSAYSGGEFAANFVDLKRGAASGLRAAAKGPRTPVGRSGRSDNFPNPRAPSPRNAPEVINGRSYSGHAIDRMQERGYTPSVVENALHNGVKSAGNTPNTMLYTDSVNKLRVVVNSKTGNVITVIPGLK